MENTILLIMHHKKKYPDFEYYLSIIEKIEDNVNTMPDITIEGCKALIDGILKTILKKMNVTYSESGRNADTTSQLLRKVFGQTPFKNSEIEDAFCHNASVMVSRITEIRNARGDISHGKPVPKDDSSDKHLAEMISSVTDGIVYYILNIYFNADWSAFEQTKYEDNPDFNELLDNENDLGGIVLYSKALFDQDLVSYEQQLNDYLSDKEEENI